MEKYRKWTDEATGINPFIIADQKQYNLFYNIITIVFFTLLFIGQKHLYINCCYSHIAYCIFGSISALFVRP